MEGTAVLRETEADDVRGERQVDDLLERRTVNSGMSVDRFEGD